MAGLAAVCLAVHADHVTKVLEVYQWTNSVSVFLEMNDSLSKTETRTNWVRSQVSMTEGQSYVDAQVRGAHVKVEIVRIDLTNRVVIAKEDGVETSYGFKPEDIRRPSANGGFTVDYKDAELDRVFDVYALLIHRTLLVHPKIRRQHLLVSIKTDGKDQFIQAFEHFLKDNNIVPIPDGDAFQVIVPQDFEKVFLEAGKGLPVPPENRLPGRYQFTYAGVQLEQVLDVYKNILGRKWIASPLPPGGLIELKTNRGLTKAEALHALDVSFVLDGVKPVYVGDDSFKLVPL